MPTFAYSAVDSLGRELSGTVTAADGNAATAKIKELGLTPKRVTLEGGVGVPVMVKVKDLLLPTFDYTAVDADGKKVTGSVDARDLQGAQDQIKAKGLFPTRVLEASKANSRGARHFFTMLIVGLIAWAAVRYMLKTFRGEGPPPPSASAPIIPS